MVALARMTGMSVLCSCPCRPSSSRMPFRSQQQHRSQAAVAPMRQRQSRRTGGVMVRAAMFDALSLSLDSAWKLVSKEGSLTKENLAGPLKEIRRSLLEADVAVAIVKTFIARLEEKSLGQKVIPGVSPNTAFIKLVNDELITLMGGALVGGASELVPGKPQIILLAGLQGVGKTTIAAKLAFLLKSQNKKVLLVATDVYRPAAIDQLVKLGASIQVPVFQLGTEVNPVEIAKRGMEEARRLKCDAVIVDTAGRLQVDEDMMTELKSIKAMVKPTDTLLVVDAMTGQEAATLAKAFNDAIDLTGSVLTKMDGDSRGGAALSVREVSGKPIKFVGVGEKMEQLEPFYPDRMAGRILGQGDVLTLWEKAQKAFAGISTDEVNANMQRMLESKFTFDDFLGQLKRMNDMGGVKMMKMLPGMAQITERQLYEAEKKFALYTALIEVMTPEERQDSSLVANSPASRKRIAAGAGKTEIEVSNMLGDFSAFGKNAAAAARSMMAGGNGMPGAPEAKPAGGMPMRAGPGPQQGQNGQPRPAARPGKEKAPKVVADKSKGFGTPVKASPAGRKK